jgi:enamine deaminase RidA (YjgF/YER057c/UK114 family)
MKQIYLPSDQTKAPLSGVIEAGGLLFVSGQIHLLDGKLAGETIEEKLAIALKNVETILAMAVPLTAINCPSQ